MEEEAPDDPDFLDRINGGGVIGESDGDDGRVVEWEIGLPSGDDLTPLSQSLIPPELASAFSINPEPARSLLDVHRASQHTISNLRLIAPSSAASAALRSFHPFRSSPSDAGGEDDPMIFEGDDVLSDKDGEGESSSRKIRVDSASPSAVAAAEGEEAESSALRPENSNDDNCAKTLKRPRLVWTPQLHKRFVDVVAHLGIKNAVPKTIMQLMNVEGLSRENVASHLQKYRLYLKRMQGLPNEGPSSPDQSFASTPVPQGLHEQQVPAPVPMPMPYAMPGMYPVPIYGSQIGVVPVNNHQVNGFPQGYEAHQLYGAFGESEKDCSGGKRFNSMVSYPRIPNDK